MGSGPGPGLSGIFVMPLLPDRFGAGDDAARKYPEPSEDSGQLADPKHDLNMSLFC